MAVIKHSTKKQKSSDRSSNEQQWRKKFVDETKDIYEHRLSFTSVPDNGPVNFWDVKPTGRYIEDCLIGEHYANQLWDWVFCEDIEKLEKGDFLKSIFMAMPKNELHRGLAIGFWSALSEKMLTIPSSRLQEVSHG